MRINYIPLIEMRFVRWFCGCFSYRWKTIIRIGSIVLCVISVLFFFSFVKNSLRFIVIAFLSLCRDKIWLVAFGFWACVSIKYLELISFHVDLRNRQQYLAAPLHIVRWFVWLFYLSTSFFCCILFSFLTSLSHRIWIVIPQQNWERIHIFQRHISWWKWIEREKRASESERQKKSKLEKTKKQRKNQATPKQQIAHANRQSLHNTPFNWGRKLWINTECTVCAISVCNSTHNWIVFAVRPEETRKENLMN